MVHKRTNRRKTLKGGRRTRRKSRKRLAKKTRRGLRSKKRKRRRKSRKSRRRRGGLGWGKKKAPSFGKCDTKANCIEAINKLNLVGGDGNADRKVMNEWYGPGKYPLMNDAAENDDEYKELLTALATKIAGVNNGALYFNNLFYDIRNQKSNFWVMDLKAAYKKTGLMDKKAEMNDSYLPYD